MNKLILTTIILSTIANFNVYSQCYNGTNTNPISSSPDSASQKSNPKNETFLNWVNTPSVGFPSAGNYTHNPFYNTFNWYPYNQISIPQNAAFNIGTVPWANGQYTMDNPFNIGLPSGSKLADGIKNPSVNERDFWWEDGWELLWMNLGVTPDGVNISTITPGSPLTIASAAPNNIPYFVLYNRYKGVIRIFANIWYNSLDYSGRYDEISTSLEFSIPPQTPKGSQVETNGLLRLVNDYDIALDQITSNLVIHAPSQGAINMNQWMVSDFQIGFDPCICTLNKAKLIFKFTAFNTITLEMTSRSITIEQQFTNKDYLTRDFMNLSEYDPDNYKPGTRIYQEMGDLLNAYDIAKKNYEVKLANYNSIESIIGRTILKSAQAGISSIGGALGDAIGNSINLTSDIKDYLEKVAPRVSMYTNGKIKLDPNDAEKYNKDLQKAAKGIISEGFDFLSTQLNVPGKPPGPPSAPTAAFTETAFKGKLTKKIESNTPELLIPGSIPNSLNGGNPGLSKQNYPAYNEVLGLFALLETPKVDVKAKYNKSLTTTPREPVSEYWSDAFYNSEGRYYFKETTTSTDFKDYEFKLSSPLKYRFNHAVRDFDFDKTKLYYSFRIKFKKHKPTPEMIGIGETHQPNLINSSDFFVESYTENGIDYMVITTPFIDVKNILNEPFHADFEYLRTYLSSYYNGPGFITKGQHPEYNYPINEIQSIDLKLMADMYFSSKGSKEQDLNTLQTFTYNLYINSGADIQMPINEKNVMRNINFLSTNEKIIKHNVGNTLFDNVHFSPSSINQFQHSSLVGNEIHVWVENAELKNKITVTPGYKTYIHFLNNLSINPESDIFPEVILDNAPSENLYNYPQIYEVTDAELSDFCKPSSNKYKANRGLTKKGNYSTDNHNEAIDINPKYEFKLSPNPASNLLYLNSEYDNFINIKILDISGKVVITPLNNIMIENNHYGIDVSSLVNGIYFCNIQLSSGEQITKKFVIAK